MPRCRIVIGFLTNDPTTQRAIITLDDRFDIVIERIKGIDDKFQILSTAAMSPTENKIVSRHPGLFEKVLDHEDLKRQIEHHRPAPPRELPLNIAAKKKPTEDAKIIKMGRGSLVNRMKSRIW